MNTLTLVLAAAVLAGNSDYESFESMRRAGFHYTPGLDCEVRVGAISAFSAGNSDGEWAIFLSERVSPGKNGAGVTITRAIPIQVEGGPISCALLKSDSEEYVYFKRIFDNDESNPSHFFAVIRAGEGAAPKALVSCGWSFGEPVVHISTGVVRVDYMNSDGTSHTSKQTTISTSCADAN